MDKSCDVNLLGVDGLDEALDEGLFEDDLGVDLAADDVDFLADLLAAGLFLADFLADDDVSAVDFLFTALAGLTGVLKSWWSPTVKLSSFIGDTEDLLLTADFLAADAVVFLALDRLVDGVELFFFFIDDGVVLGRGVPLMGFEDLLAGVAVCLAIFKSILVM